MTDLVEARLRRAFTRVAEGTPIPPLPGRDGGSGSRRRWRRRSTAIVALGVVAIGAGVPVVAAAGGSATETAFGPTHAAVPPAAPGHPALPVIAANDATGKEVVTLRQDGETWEIWVAATAPAGGQCVSILQPVPGGYVSHSLECTAAVPHGVEFGAGGGDSTGWVTQIGASGAATVTLTAGPRLLERLPVGDGQSAAWIPAAWYGRPITVTGYSEVGAVIGSTTETFSVDSAGSPDDAEGMSTRHGVPLHRTRPGCGGPVTAMRYG